MTKAELIEALKEMPDDAHIHIFSPEGLMMTKDICLSTSFINWYGQIINVSGTNWFRIPKDD